MAYPRTMRAGVVLAVALAARAAWSASPCEEDRAQTGVALAAREGGLEVAAVDPGSAAAESGLRAGDALVQVNASMPRSCADYARAVRDAREGKKALLVLVRRSEGTVPLALGSATWERAVATAPPPPPPEPPSVRALVATPAPAPVAPEARTSLDALARDIRALAPADRQPGQLADYSHRLLRLHRQVEAFAARRAAPAGVVDGVRTVLRYFDAAEVAWAADESLRERERRPRHVPSSEAAAAPFFADSEAAATIEEFPFLRATVSRDPRPGLVGESSGLWRPVEARALLWAHGREELDRLTAWLERAGQ